MWTIPTQFVKKKKIETQAVVGKHWRIFSIFFRSLLLRITQNSDLKSQ